MVQGDLIGIASTCLQRACMMHKLKSQGKAGYIVKCSRQVKCQAQIVEGIPQSNLLDERNPSKRVSYLS